MTDPQPGDLMIVPALFDHAKTVYEKMRETAKQEEVDDTTLLVYEGYLTTLVLKELRLSMPYYTAITRHLVTMGCIEQLRRGGGTTPSRWVLWTPPTIEAWRASEGIRPRRGNATTVLQQRVKDLSERVIKLEEIVDNLVVALREGKRAA
jgi:hypothetical protein